MTTTVVNPFSSGDAGVYHALGAAGVRRILAEGDSWMSIFVPGQGNLLNYIETGQDAVILDLSYPGDTLAEMASGEHFELFRRLTGDPRHGYEFDLILLLGGGNDVMGRGLNRFLIRQRGRPGSVKRCLSEPRLKAVLAGIEANFEKFLVELRSGALNRNTPVLTCTYDYVTPRDAGVSVLGARLRGPWVAPALRRKGIEEPRLQKAVSDYLLRRYRRLLLRLARRHRGRFYAIDTLGTLEPAAADEGESADWADEIHPSARGWEKLARAINPEIKRILAA